MSFSLVLPAAGSGSRLDMGRPKALVDVGGVALVRRTLERFSTISGLDETLVVAPPGSVEELRGALEGLVWETGEIRVVAGGETRQDSVRVALDALSSAPEIVCVHDAARPLVSTATIGQVVSAAESHGASTAASRPTDSVRLEDETGGSIPLNRDRVWLIQTPQAFRFDLLFKAHQHAKATAITATDDASLVETCCQVSPEIVLSDGVNLKITRAEDLQMVRLLIGD
jgi:2-C-methyl-D-erythritol 4-phosphate cytidylyltransferase